MKQSQHTPIVVLPEALEQPSFMGCGMENSNVTLGELIGEYNRLIALLRQAVMSMAEHRQLTVENFDQVDLKNKHGYIINGSQLSKLVKKYSYLEFAYDDLYFFMPDTLTANKLLRGIDYCEAYAQWEQRFSSLKA
ncbi:hypothetical protein [Persicobacter psychrovividus]|uniref:Uncharacterized protein n=1 Tax=Persicobacter psychrovividus TaxID=387638 RepID=A0ABM7VEZ8_9BACT|nr:hypothetical protein PEPS_17940 [Persicobacter psychrovividus]